MPYHHLQSWVLPFLTLSYPTQPPKNPDCFPDFTFYDYGLLDLCFIVTCITVMAVLRDFFRLVVFEPFAAWVLNNDLERRIKRLSSNGTNGKISNGVAHRPLNITKEQQKNHRSVLRFAEQGWLAVYYVFIWSYGLYIQLNLPRDLWTHYPHIPIPGPVKFYYLVQIATYLHQTLILNAEAPRKDHWRMMSHHFITVFLMGTSYTYNFTRVGCLIMVIMDWCDVLLPIAKMHRYLKVRQVIVDSLFATFLVTWFITRHVIFIPVIYSTLFVAPKQTSFNWDPSTGIYYTEGVYYMFCSALIALQGLQLLWAVTLAKIAWRVITTTEGASDDRSEDEDSDAKDK